MKNQFLVAAILLFFSTSCKKEVNEPLTVPTVQEEMVASASQIFCYQGIVKKDTFNLSFQLDADKKIKGELAYLFFEKDKNNGTVEGEMIGDTLKVQFTFMSEGLKSVRQVVFLKKGKILIEAYGDVEVKEGKTVFTDPKKLYFDSASVLAEIECP